MNDQWKTRITATVVSLALFTVIHSTGHMMGWYAKAEQVGHIGFILDAGSYARFNSDDVSLRVVADTSQVLTFDSQDIIFRVEDERKSMPYGVLTNDGGLDVHVGSGTFRVLDGGVIEVRW